LKDRVVAEVRVAVKTVWQRYNLALHLGRFQIIVVVLRQHKLVDIAISDKIIERLEDASLALGHFETSQGTSTDRYHKAAIGTSTVSKSCPPVKKHNSLDYYRNHVFRSIIIAGVAANDYATPG